MKLLFFLLTIFLISNQLTSSLLDSLKLLGGGGRVVGGYEVKPQFKYTFMISIQYKSKQSCGGTIISYNKILTAAHCTFDDIKDFKVHLHRHDLSKSISDEGASIYNVTNRLNHPKFKSAAEGYDISIWTINKEDDKTNTIVYPKLDPGELSVKTGLKLFAIGWGRTVEKGDPSNTLLEVQLPIVDFNKCKNNYKSQGLNLDINTQLCAGYFEDMQMDTCQGDSGGPLFIKIEQVYYIVGIVSYGIGCASPDLPGIYSRVSFLSTFIQENI
ncbi:trypsin-like serine protease [Neoconidiobolus thromboides FSU 785]|nr:trypsin-like serine protease [Neoconidiobolus thromboides FSU 785]